MRTAETILATVLTVSKVSKAVYFGRPLNFVMNYLLADEYVSASHAETTFALGASEDQARPGVYSSAEPRLLGVVPRG